MSERDRASPDPPRPAIRITALPPPEPLSARLRRATPLPDEALYGLAGDVVRELSEYSEADPAALLLEFLVMFGSAAGPEPHAEIGRGRNPGREFVLIVGDAGTGRKGTAHDLVEELFAAADPDWFFACIHRGLQSPEQMIQHVADGASTDCRLLMLETEFQRLVVRMAQAGNYSGALRNAYDGTPLAAGKRSAGNAHISVLGHITPGELERHHRRLSEAGGLESRFLYALVNRSRDVSPFATRPPSQGLIDQVRDALDDSREEMLDGENIDPITAVLCEMRGVFPPSQIPISEDVQRDWDTVYRKQIAALSSPALGTMWQRGDTHVIRLSVIFAITDGAKMVGPAHIEAAIALWRYCSRSAEMIFGVTAGRIPPARDPRKTAKVLTALQRAHPQWVKRSVINDEVFGRNAATAEVSAVLRYLIAEGLAEYRSVQTGGRPGEEYRYKE